MTLPKALMDKLMDPRCWLFCIACGGPLVDWPQEQREKLAAKGTLGICDRCFETWDVGDGIT